MSTLFSPESLILVITAFLVFKGLQGVNILKIAASDVYSQKATATEDVLDLILRLFLTLPVAGLAVASKWTFTQTASMSVFAILFVTAAVAAIIRYSLVVISATKVKADPLVLLCTLAGVIAIAITAAAYSGNPPKLAVKLIESPQTILPLILIACTFLYRPVFVLQELADAKFGLTTGTSYSRIINSTFAGAATKVSANTFNMEWFARLLATGLTPFIILAASGIVPGLPYLAALSAIGGLRIAPMLARYWAVAESIKHHKSGESGEITLNSSAVLKYGVLIFPLILMLIVSGLHGLASVYVAHVTWTSGTQSVWNFLPAKNVVLEWPLVMTEIIALVYGVCAVVTVSYKRLVSVLISFSQ